MIVVCHWFCRWKTYLRVSQVNGRSYIHSSRWYYWSNCGLLLVLQMKDLFGGKTGQWKIFYLFVLVITLEWLWSTIGFADERLLGGKLGQWKISYSLPLVITLEWFWFIIRFADGRFIWWYIRSKEDILFTPTGDNTGMIVVYHWFCRWKTYFVVNQVNGRSFIHSYWW